MIATQPINKTTELLAAQYAAAVLSARGAPSTPTWRVFQERARDIAAELHDLTGRDYWWSKLAYHARALKETPQ